MRGCLVSGREREKGNLLTLLHCNSSVGMPEALPLGSCLILTWGIMLVTSFFDGITSLRAISGALSRQVDRGRKRRIGASEVKRFETVDVEGVWPAVGVPATATLS
jgi:hypothetical protein